MSESRERPAVPWERLTAEEQTALRVEFGHYLDTLPPTCSMESKLARFRGWLRERGVAFEGVPGRK